MTNERAIELLHRLQDEQFDGIHGDERREALSMAVRALSGEGDLIYRQDAIDACCFGITHARAFNVETGAAVDLFAESNKELHKAIERIEALPPAQPEVAKDTNVPNNDCISRQAAIDAVVSAMIDGADAELVEGVMELLPSAQPHWIPCSERLPEEDEDVLVCSEEGDIDIACWMPEQWTDEPHIEWWSGEYRVYAVAWMPLPEPYGGESDE